MCYLVMGATVMKILAVWHAFKCGVAKLSEVVPWSLTSSPSPYPNSRIATVHNLIVQFLITWLKFLLHVNALHELHTAHGVVQCILLIYVSNIIPD